ncbi:MAG: hypothetical protein M5R36_13870 [Deltaproteobacteria bacterium]|nr:hypothetical protein [Deltaproteobacteria bacterium]
MNDGRIGVIRKLLDGQIDLVLDVRRRQRAGHFELELRDDDGQIFQALRIEFAQPGNGPDFLFKFFRDLRFDFLRPRAGIDGRHHDYRKVDFRDQLLRQLKEGKGAEHDQRDDKNRRENGPVNGDAGDVHAASPSSAAAPSP